MSNERRSVRMLEVDTEQAGQRLDNFLTRHLKGVPKSVLYRIIRKGEVRVNKGRVKPDYRLQQGDLVRIPPVRQGEPVKAGTPADATLRRLEASILWQDPGLLVLNKPSGMAVHGGSGLRYGVIEALRALYPKERHLELVHRLDRDTSGCLLVARKRSYLRHLQQQIRDKQVQKRYQALLMGQFYAGEQVVEAPLKKNTLKSGERMVRVDPLGKPATSIFASQRVYDLATLVEVLAVTGRTHQIRVHSAWLGHPIAGDDKYGDRDFNQRMAGLGLQRLFLHARQIEFQIPEQAAPVLVTAPLSPDLKQVLDALE